MSDTTARPDDPLPADTHRSTFVRTVHLVFTPAPGRLRNTLLLVAGVMIITAIWEIFRIPDTATACYVILFVSRDVRTASVASAIGIAVMGPIAMGGVILVTMASLSEPAVRVIAMAVLSFVVMFLSRAARSGVAFFAIGFLVVYGLNTADSLGELGLQPYTYGNTTTNNLPTGLFLPPEEALLHTVLWLIATMIIPGTVVVLLNKAFGRDPAVLLRNGIALRLRACADFCEHRPGAGARLETIARRGSPELLTLAELAEKDHGAKQEPKAANTAEVRGATRVMLACLAVRELDDAGRDWMAAVGRRCRSLAGGKEGDGAPDGTGRQAGPLGREAHAGLDAVSDARRRRRSGAEKAPEKQAQSFWADNAFSAANVQFALKVTISVMICVTLNNAFDWQGIGTDVVTCFFVALGTVGESGHKMILRIGGCLAGSAFGIGSVILLMPLMTDLPELLALVAVATFIAGWIANGGERISYAGWQFALASSEVVLQGYGPVTDMEAAKNRIIGILIGITVSYVVMATLWPVRVERLATRSLADTLDGLKHLVQRPDKPEAVREGISVAVSKAQSLTGDVAFEGGDLGAARAGAAFAGRVQALVIPAEMLAASRERAYPDAVAGFLDELAAWLRRERPRPPPPEPPAAPEPPDGEGPAYALMDRELAGLHPDTLPR